MKSLAAVATLALVAFATQPALAQEKKESGTETVAGLPTLPTDSVEALFAMREKWGTEPTMSSPGGGSDSGSKDKSK
jgi:hypothetical protein